jgi:hypothetical protein
MSLIKKAIRGEIPVYFVLAHGKDYSPTKQRTMSVPKNKMLILPVELGDQLTYQGAEALAKKLATRQSLNALLSNLPKKFSVVEENKQYPDTLLQFHDPYYWTGIYELPELKLKNGLGKQHHTQKNVNMMNVDKIYTPPKKNVSTFLSEEPNKEAIYIIASCRGVKGVPANEIYSSKTAKAKRTSAQKKKLEQVKRNTMGGAKRPASKSASKSSTKKSKVEPSRKRKRTPSESSRKKQKMTTPSPVKAVVGQIATMMI